MGRILNWLINLFNPPRPTPPPVPPSPPPPPPPPAPGPITDVAAQLLVLHNEERRARGGPPLRIDARLTAAAQKHADWMYRNNRMDHNQGRVTFDQRIKAEGYRMWTGGENIAAGQRTPEQVVNSWMNSSGHRANILNTQYQDVGFGVHGTYWCVDFASQPNSRSIWGINDEITLAGPLEESAGA